MLIMDVHGAVFSNSDIVERVPQSIFFQHVSSRFGRTSRHDFDHIVFLHVIISPIHKRSFLYLYYNGIMIMYWPNTVEHHPSCGHGHIFDGSHLDDCGSGVRQVVVVVVLQVFVVGTGNFSNNSRSPPRSNDGRFSSAKNLLSNKDTFLRWALKLLKVPYQDYRHFDGKPRIQIVFKLNIL